MSITKAQRDDMLAHRTLGSLVNEACVIRGGNASCILPFKSQGQSIGVVIPFPLLRPQTKKLLAAHTNMSFMWSGHTQCNTHQTYNTET